MRRVAELRRDVEETQREAEELRRRLDAQLAQLARQQAALAEAEAQHALTETFWAGGGNLLTGVTDDTLQHIVSCVPSAKDLLRLGLSCVRLGTRSVRGVDVIAAAAPAQLWSIVEEEARRWLMKCTDQERGWVPRRERESWLGLMRGVELLRRAAVFGRSHEAKLTLSDDGSQATRSASGCFSPTYYAAASEAVMQVGRHYAQFTVLRNVNMSFGAGLGVIRPGWDVEGEVEAIRPGHCFYVTDEGSHYPGDRDWEGMQAAEEGDRIGLLLDLDQGSMTVYKNDERLGVMVASGLIGPYCWAAELMENGDSVRIEPAEAPASPTPEELARALAYAVAHGSPPP